MGLESFFGGVFLLTAGVLQFRRNHIHLNGRPVGPLRRVFKVNRATVYLWLFVLTMYSTVFWGLPLIPNSYQILIPAFILVGFVAFVPIWNGWLKRAAARQYRAGQD
jgi:hypothetical protein